MQFGFQKFMSQCLIGFILGTIIVTIYYFSIYSSDKKTWENGISVVGTIEKRKSWVWKNNAEITYEADGKEMKTEVTLKKKDWKSISDSDPKHPNEVEVHYRKDKPEKGVTQMQIDFDRKTSIESAICIPLLCGYAIIEKKLKKRLPT